MRIIDKEKWMEVELGNPEMSPAEMIGRSHVSRARKSPINREEGNRRLLMLADFLESLPARKFYFGSVLKDSRAELEPSFLQLVSQLFKDLSEHKPVHECNTIGCAVGWTPFALRESVYFVTSDLMEGRDDHLGSVIVKNAKGKEFLIQVHDYEDVAAVLFGLNRHIASHLFTPSPLVRFGRRGSYKFGLNATPQEVAKRLEHFLETGMVDY